MKNYQAPTILRNNEFQYESIYAFNSGSQTGELYCHPCQCNHTVYKDFNAVHCSWCGENESPNKQNGEVICKYAVNPFPN